MVEEKGKEEKVVTENPAAGVNAGNMQEEEDTARLVKMTSSEYDAVLGDVAEIIQKAYEKYVNINEYELYLEDSPCIYNEGLPVEYAEQCFLVVLINRKTEHHEGLGKIAFADDCWTNVSEEEKSNGYVLVYSYEDIRKDAEELFQEWAKEEAEEDE